MNGERKIKINDTVVFFQAHTSEIKFRNQELYLINLYDLTEQKTIFAKSKITQQPIDNLEIEIMKLKFKKM